MLTCSGNQRRSLPGGEELMVETRLLRAQVRRRDSRIACALHLPERFGPIAL
jgi:hypothetical protein